MGTPLNRVLVDTNVLIDLSRGNPDAALFMNRQIDADVSTFTSVISAMEFVVGCRNKAEVMEAQEILDDFILLQVSPVESERAYELMFIYNKSHNLGIPDALIAATALSHGMELITKNIKHFGMIPDLVVKEPY